MPFIDMHQQQFGRLLVIGLAPYTRRAKWHCRCACGNEIVVDGRQLRSGGTQSCGCLQRERTSQASLVHGDSGSALYRVWHAMRRRCSDPNHKDYRNYGGRGIVVCQEWDNGYEAFRDWADDNGYQPGLKIERRDNDGPYSPNNCEWATQKQQCRNKRTNRAVVRSDGKVFRTVSEAREAVGGAWDSKIVAVCRGRRKAAYGYGWQYAEQRGSLLAGSFPA